jgi:hypothetical protein
MFWIHPTQPEFEALTIGGIFSSAHLLALFIFGTLGYLLYRYLGKPTSGKYQKHKVLSIIMIILELIRIGWNLEAATVFVPNDILPLFTCGIFIFIYPLFAFQTKGKEIATHYLKIGAFGTGLLFLVFPTTSLGMFPFWHINTLISLTMHTVMSVVGATFLFDKKLTFTFQDVHVSFALVLGFAFISFMYNSFDPTTNFFFIAKPLEETPLVFIFSVLGQPLYGITILLLHLLAGYGMVFLKDKVTA